MWNHVVKTKQTDEGSYIRADPSEVWQAGSTPDQWRTAATRVGSVSKSAPGDLHGLAVERSFGRAGAREVVSGEGPVDER
jgi:hypothetical protein